MTDNAFRPFDTMLDEGRALALLRQAVAGAEDGELFLERKRSEALVLDDGRIKTASYDASEGFGLRAVKGEVTGYAHATEISESAVKRAVETARLAVGDGGGTLADAPIGTNRRLYSDADPMLDASFAGKIDVLKEIDAFTRGLDRRVVQVSAALSAGLQEVEILRPEGLRLRDARPMARLNISVIVEQNGRRESGGMGGGGRFGLSGLIDPAHWQPVAREALRIALVNLEAEAAPAGVMDIVLVFAPAAREVHELRLAVPEGTTLKEALHLAGWLERFPAIEQAPMAFGIWGRQAPTSTLLRPGDRVEVYRELRVDEQP